MGLIRFLLAVSVVGAHTVGFIFIGGKNAVLIFYMISGYLISYVLNDTASYSSKKSFYLNRYLRIWPMYAFTAALTLILSLSAQFVSAIGTDSHTAQSLGGFRDVLPALPWISGAIVVLCNLFLVGLDLSSFVFFNGSDLQFGTSTSTVDIPGFKLLVVPQAWTLGVEICFYLIAPFILRNRRKTVFTFLTFSFFAIVGWITGISQSNPWDYKFSLTTIYLFLMGSVSQQFVSQRTNSRVKQTNFLDKFAVPSTIALVVGFQLFPTDLKTPASFLLQFWFFFVLPALFRYSKDRKYDKILGNLSYPIYLTHMLIISLLFDIEKQLFGGTNSQLTFILAVLVSSAMGFMLNTSIFAGLENKRRRIREQ